MVAFQNFLRSSSWISALDFKHFRRRDVKEWVDGKTIHVKVVQTWNTLSSSSLFFLSPSSFFLFSSISAFLKCLGKRNVYWDWPWHMKYIVSNLWHIFADISIDHPLRYHLHFSFLFLLFAPLLFLLPCLLLFLHLLLNVFQPLSLFLLLLLLLHWGEQLLWAFHQLLVLFVYLFPGYPLCGLGGQENKSEWHTMVTKWENTLYFNQLYSYIVQLILSVRPQ